MSDRGGQIQGQKNMLILFERFHLCGVKAFYRMSKSILFTRYRCFNVLVLWLFYSNLRGHFWHFFTFFCYKNWNIETNTLRFYLNVHFNDLFWMKNFDLEIYVNLGWFWPMQDIGKLLNFVSLHVVVIW